MPDERWDNDVLHSLRDVPGSAFEAVDASGLMVNPGQPPPADSEGPAWRQHGPSFRMGQPTLPSTSSDPTRRPSGVG